jgi:hypothetical protein
MKHKQLAALAAAGLAAAGLGIGAAQANASSVILRATPRTVDTIAVRQGSWSLTGTYTAVALDAQDPVFPVSVNCVLSVRPFGSTIWTDLATDRVHIGGDLQDATALVYVEAEHLSTSRFTARVTCRRGNSTDGTTFIADGGTLTATAN